MKTSERFMIATCCLLWVAAGLFAQTKDSVAVQRDSVLPLTKMEVAATDSLAVADSVSPVQGQDSVPVRATKVYLEHTNTLSFDEAVRPDVQILTGDVCFRHDSSYMYCDSAYFYEQTNSLEAFSNVRMEQGDTLFVFGDYLRYDGNARIAYLRRNVRMENRQVTLFTDSLNYERIPNIGYYFEGGLIVDSLNQLSSFYGQYSPGTKLAVFNDKASAEKYYRAIIDEIAKYNL